MRLTAAFFANRAEVVNDMLNVEGGFWATTTVAPGSVGFECRCVVLCETAAEDVGKRVLLHIDASGPTGRRWTAAQSADFTVPGPVAFMVTPRIALPIEPDGGRHVYALRLAGQHERVDVAVDVLMAPTG